MLALIGLCLVVSLPTNRLYNYNTVVCILFRLVGFATHTNVKCYGSLVDCWSVRNVDFDQILTDFH